VSDGSADPRPVSQRVVEAVAEERGVDHSDLEPLYYTIDPGSLEDLFARDGRSAAGTRPGLAFTYEGHRVNVSADGSVEVTPIETSEFRADRLVSGVDRRT